MVCVLLCSIFSFIIGRLRPQTSWPIQILLSQQEASPLSSLNKPFNASSVDSKFWYASRVSIPPRKKDELWQWMDVRPMVIRLRDDVTWEGQRAAKMDSTYRFARKMARATRQHKSKETPIVIKYVISCLPRAWPNDLNVNNQQQTNHPSHIILFIHSQSLPMPKTRQHD
jgi:hypothetical protein